MAAVSVLRRVGRAARASFQGASNGVNQILSGRQHVNTPPGEGGDAAVVPVVASRHEAATHRDPIMEIVAHAPRESVKFIKVVMFFGATTGVILSIPCLVYLLRFWGVCKGYQRPLRWWMLTNCSLQLAQVPVRCHFLNTLVTIEASPRPAIVTMLGAMTASRLWRLSQWLSIANCCWFIVGAVWLFSVEYCAPAPGLWKLTVFVIALSMLRLLITLACFSYFFPPRTTYRLSRIPYHRDRRKGLSDTVIRSLPRTKFSEASRSEIRPELCSICLSEFEEHEYLRRLPCQHSFHQCCVDKWLSKCASCPLCVQSMDALLKGGGSEATSTPMLPIAPMTATTPSSMLIDPVNGSMISSSLIAQQTAYATAQIAPLDAISTPLQAMAAATPTTVNTLPCNGDNQFTVATADRSVEAAQLSSNQLEDASRTNSPLSPDTPHSPISTRSLRHQSVLGHEQRPIIGDDVTISGRRALAYVLGSLEDQ